MPQTGVFAAEGPHGRSSPAGLTFQLETRDFDEVARALRHWDLAIDQLGRGPFRGELDIIQAGGVEVLRLALNRVIQARGSLKPSHYAFSLVTPANGAATWRGCHQKAGQINIIRPGDVIDHLTSAGYENLVVMVDAEIFRKKAEVLYGIAFDEWLGRVTAVQLGWAAFNELERFLRRFLSQAGAPQAAVTSAQGGWPIEETCIRLLLQALTSGDPAVEAGARSTEREQLVRRAEDFMLAHLDTTLLAADLCDAVRASARTLRYAFHDRFGLSPMAYFKSKKLNAIRHELKTADPTSLTVHEIARRWGFDHTGNFAADYRRLFGELPSHTLNGW
jgi:AraC family ethanolamine operon transcriptional activator